MDLAAGQSTRGTGRSLHARRRAHIFWQCTVRLALAWGGQYGSPTSAENFSLDGRYVW